MIRRHTKGEKEIHFEPALTVVSGNYVTAKRRGVVEGTDYGLTGEVRRGSFNACEYSPALGQGYPASISSNAMQVRFVMKDAIKQQLDLGNIVLLSNLGEA